MVFKKTPPPPFVPDSPEKIIMDLPRRKILGVLLHQGELMRTYRATAVTAPDVAIQMPTGSGKTLVALMIAEWRRRKFRERIVYLCPTNQLVHQVVEQADDQYGLTVNGFTGEAKEYSPAAKAEYRNGDRIAVTNYSSLFNVKPFFADADVIVVDDAHAAENYIAAQWTFRVERVNPRHQTLHAAIASVLKAHLEPVNFSRLTGEWDNPSDLGWVDKLPTPKFAALHDELRTVVDANLGSLDLRYSWRILRDHLYACHLYVSTADILIRPLIPPTWTHAPFTCAKQRLFMSATLGAGGDLERLTGRTTIKRLQVPDGWDRQGIGRRYFMFPAMSLKGNEAARLRRELMRAAGRSLVLVPSEKHRAEIAEDIAEDLGFRIFSVDELEKSKRPFVTTEQAVAVIAGRYDGIDLPGDQCRLLFIEGLPKATNLQERFLMSRMGANTLFNERIQTRVLQAIGRCTRSLQDFSAVVVGGEELTDYLVDRRRRVFLHPELQAEIEFGVEQSQTTSVADFLDNAAIFFENKIAWEDANQDILAKRSSSVQQAMPAMNDLQEVVHKEIDYQTKLWQADYEAALDSAESVLGRLAARELRGYRALWHYLAGSAAWFGAQAGVTRLVARARTHFSKAKAAAPGIPWLVGLSTYQDAVGRAEEPDPTVLHQIERLEHQLARLGTVHDRNFAAHEQEILNGLMSAEGFEQAHVKLGALLGFDAGKVEADASPDPWWIADNICFVFEDHAGAKSDSVLDATKARQAATHPAWMHSHVRAAENARVLPVLLTPVTRATEGAFPHLNSVALWPLAEFRAWATRALVTVRDLRRTFVEPGDLDWRTAATEMFKTGRLDAVGLRDWLSTQSAGRLLNLAEDERRSEAAEQKIAADGAAHRR